MLKNNEISLRSLEITDSDFLFNLENDESIWSMSGTTKEFTKTQIVDYIKNAKQDILVQDQYRFVIDFNGKPIGCADIYDYDLLKSSAAIGIVILNNYRRRGCAKFALRKLIRYCCDSLFLKKLYCKISDKNLASIKLFTSLGFSTKDRYIYTLDNICN